jgi:cellulose synthase/poly-beta-1,6-N-acetylglucosamine synthase-like glycosyltransferase
MTFVALILLPIAIALVVFQFSATLPFLALLRSYSTAATDSPYQPKATIILSLRGTDPFLADCIMALLHQDYNDYQIYIVVDSVEDPAWQLVQQVLQRAEMRLTETRLSVTVRPLVERRKTCSLKCSALIQAVREMDQTCEVIALIDADTIAHPQWLQQLVKPLADPAVGITNGTRWYTPTGIQIGTLNRYLWNSFAIVSTYLSEIPWGGTLAVRTRLVLQADPVKLWGNALCEDVPLGQMALKQKLKIQFVPSLIIVNQEECSLPSFVRWATRQLVLVRLYHPSGWTILWSGLFGGAVALCTMLALVIAVLIHQPTAIRLLALDFAIVWIGSTIIPLILIEQGVHRLVAVWGKPLPPISLPKRLSLYGLFVPAYGVSFWIMVAAMLARSIEWRGITYRVQPKKQVYMEAYFPYQSPRVVLNSKASILD